MKNRASSRKNPAPVAAPIGIALIIGAVAILAGGGIHLHDWLVTYRHIPSSVPGWAVVRVGFVANAAVSLVMAGALFTCAYRATRAAPVVILAALGFQAASLAALIVTRTGSLFGWSELSWTAAANRTRAVEIVALLAVTFAGAFLAAQRWLVASSLGVGRQGLRP